MDEAKRGMENALRVKPLDIKEQYRTVAGLLSFNKNTLQLIFQIRGWQVKQRPIGFRLRVQAMPHRWRKRLMSGGQPTCVASEQGELVGPAWRW